MEQKDRRIKIALIAHFKNSQVSGHLVQQGNWFVRVSDKLRSKDCDRLSVGDYAQWVTNAIAEFEKRLQEVELHVVSPYPNLKGNVQEFEMNGIYYHFFHNEIDNALYKFCNKMLACSSHGHFISNRKKIISLVENIKPDLVHIIGAENPFYSLSACDLASTSIPVIVQLQTMMSDPKFEENYFIKHRDYVHRVDAERKVLQAATFIGTNNSAFADIVRKYVKPDAMIVKTRLALGEKVYERSLDKPLYDFVYFAKDIAKAADWAIESLAIAIRSNPGLKLLVIGGYDAAYKKQLDSRIAELGIKGNIEFTGSLPTHDDVILNVRKARIALLPLKIDYIAGTIRESIANGLPVVTSVTAGTPHLNEHRESVLLSDPADHKTMAQNMLKILNDVDLQQSLVLNGRITIDEMYGNAAAINQTIDTYKAVLAYKNNGTPIPEHLMM